VAADAVEAILSVVVETVVYDFSSGMRRGFHLRLSFFEIHLKSEPRHGSLSFRYLSAFEG